jgi:membrane protein YqaA with SNARE-associated domain
MTPDSSVSSPGTGPWARAKAWLGRLYARVEFYANTPAALTALLVVAAIDSAFFPVPPFVLLIPMVIAAPHRWLRLTLLSTVASVVGSFLGYAMGVAMRGGLQLFHIDLNVRLDLGPDWWRRALTLLALLAGALAAISAVQAVRRRPMAAVRTWVAAAVAVAFVVLAWNTDGFEVHGTLRELLGRNWWTLAVACMLAPAFKLATIGSGLVGVPLPGFCAAVLIARLVRFGVAAGLARFGGPSIRERLLRQAHAHPLQSGPSPAVET